MRILINPITVVELQDIANNTFGDMVKAVVDVEKELVAIDAEMHADLEALFLENGSIQENLWGINFYPEMEGEDFIEFDSMINIRPRQGNRSRGVESSETQQLIIEVVNKWVKR